MTYGSAPYGRTPWGGIVAADDISFIYLNPYPDSTGNLVTAPVQFIAHTATDFAVSSLEVLLNGVPAIQGGVFQAGYSGAISPSIGNLSVSITHPDFVGGAPCTVDINVSTKGGTPLSASYLFHVGQAQAQVSETITLMESLNFLGLNAFSVDGYTIQVTFFDELALDNIGSADRYRFTTPAAGTTPITVFSATPTLATAQTGLQGQVVSTQGTPSRVFDTVTGTFTVAHIGDYIHLSDSDQPGPHRIVAVSGSQVTLDHDLVPPQDNGTFVPGTGFTSGTGSVNWAHTGGAVGVTLKTNKSTNGKPYRLAFNGLRTVNDAPFDRTVQFNAVSPKPQAVSAEFLPDGGSLVLTFNEPMRADTALFDVEEYTLVGPGTPAITEVRPIDDSTVLLITSGIQTGSYTLEVNATGTPKDIAGNPIDPLFNEAIFVASVPITNRSIFTDKGPITKPELTLFNGATGTIQTTSTTFFGNVTLNEVILPGGLFTSAHVGKSLELDGSLVNAGTYKITSVLSSTRLRIEANLRLPDPANGSLTWRVFDPRTGEIADDPADVDVYVNGLPVTPSAVIGLLGQVVLASPPSPTDDVQVDYSYIPDPTIELRRLNSREFKLNGWLTDSGRQGPTQHSYRFRNVLISPSTFEATDLEADQAQPLLRELHYRAFERAYSVALNDPNLLLLNTPIHRIAYPPLSRTIPEENISYTGDTLPEVAESPWERKGIGLASVVSGNLVVQDNTDGPYPSGNPLFWVRVVDLTFPHVFALTWRMVVNSTTPDGIFTGISVGWSDDEKVAVVGFLLDGATRKIGFLKKGQGNDLSVAAAWTGGVSGVTSTGVAATFDWSTLHSYRILRGLDGVIRLYTDGDVAEILRITPDELPFLEELNDPFDQAQGVFFGSLSREAKNVSTWDFVRYLALPTNPEQTAPSIFVAYEGDEAPEESTPMWTPVGSHGNENISGSTLVLDSTSATANAGVGLVGGDFRGFTRIEPLLAESSDVVLDFGLQLRTFTHGITPNAVTAAVDDGNRLVQVSFFPTKAQPKISYPGRSLPDEATPRAWTALGGETGRMKGQILVIEDDSTTDGRVYAIEDLEPGSSDDRIIEANIDYYIEFKFKVNSYTPDGLSENFCGATVDVFDGSRSLGLMIRQIGASTRRLALHSDGLLLGGSSQFDFDWFDGVEHTVRMVKNTGGDLVSLFVDLTLIGTFPYSSFSASVGNPTISFGSSTAVSSAAKSVVEWSYVNVWRAQPSTGVRRYVGLWRGFDSDALTGYHLPLKASGSAQIAGNALTDLAANFTGSGVAVGDDLVLDVGSNKGTYSVATVGATTLTITGSFPSTPSEVGYRVPSQVDWTTNHNYRVVRDPGGAVSLLLDSNPTPIIRVDYSSTTLPASSLGFASQISSGLPSVTWGAFDPTNLSQTAWDFVRYGVVNSASRSEDRIVPHHQVLNQRNVMSSPEHLSGSVIHDHTQFSSASTGVPYPWHDYVENPAVVAFTRLNEGTPLVPSTQTYEVRRPTPVMQFLSGLNRPEDVLNGDGDFLLNDGATEIRLLVPNDVLYNSLEVVEQTTGSTDYIAPFSDEYNPISLRQLNWQKEVCGTYAGDVVPEADSNFGTPWVLESDDPGNVTTTAFSGALTYSVSSTGNTIYRNATPLTDPAGLNTKVEFRLRVLNDASSGTGDTGIRFGFSAFGTITAALAFVTTPVGAREVRVLDLNSNAIVGSIQFDFLDGAYHVYQLVKNIEDGTVDFLIDP